MSRILVVYGTTDGHTAKIAEFVATTLRSGGFLADIAEASDAPMPDGYGAVIVAASVHAGGYQRSVARWVRAAVPLLQERATAFVSVCLGVLQHDAAVDSELDSMRQRFLTQTGWRPDDAKIVAGALLYTQYGWLKRCAMKRIASKAGGDTDTSRDFEYTDWNDLRTFVTEFAGKNASRMDTVPHGSGDIGATVPVRQSLARRVVRASLGTTLVLHGLANAVLPMRAIDAVEPGVWGPAAGALYVGAIAGFVAAGLAVLGVRPLRRLESSLAIAAGLCALVAQVILRSGDLWVGVVLSLTLPAMVLLWSFKESSRSRMQARRRHIVGNVVGLVFLAWVALAAGLWPQYGTWGATASEWRLAR
jgi:menaquinone-dependent protoporphyrinogen oxidase